MGTFWEPFGNLEGTLRNLGNLEGTLREPWEPLLGTWEPFFSSSMADVALWLGPYMSISSKNGICTRTEKARKCRQITTNQPSHRPARRPANPPARLAFRQKKQQTRHTKRGKSPNKNTHKKICHRTQWSDHCITLKNMHTMN